MSAISSTDDDCHRWHSPTLAPVSRLCCWDVSTVVELFLSGGTPGSSWRLNSALTEAARSLWIASSIAVRFKASVPSATVMKPTGSPAIRTSRRAAS